MPEITNDAINAYAVKVIRDQATGLDYLDLAEHMFDDTVIGGVKLAELDGPDIDDVQRRVLDQVHLARLAVGWPAIDNFIGMPGGRLQDWANAIRQLPADQHAPMPLHILGDLVAVLAEYGTLVDHFVECPTLAGDDPYVLAACRVCGCTEATACAGGCSWVADPWQDGYLCSSCLPADPVQWLEPLQDLAEFEISVMRGTVARASHVHVDHVPCQTIVFGLPDDPDHLDLDDLLELVAAHQCDHVAEPRDVSQIITVDVDGDEGTVTAVVHGSRRLDDEEQAAMAEILRATRKLEREKRREKARQLDEDVRAVDRLLRELHGRSGVDALKAVTRLQERFGDRIKELRQRDADAEGTVSGG
jgi:hypothetical protein